MPFLGLKASPVALMSFMEAQDKLILIFDIGNLIFSAIKFYNFWSLLPSFGSGFVLPKILDPDPN